MSKFVQDVMGRGPLIKNTAYFSFRGKELKEVVFFLTVEYHHAAFPPEMMEYLSEVFDIRPITKAEAETYQMFDVAEVYGPEQLGVIKLWG